MAVFDVSFLNPNAKRGSGGYGVLVDQLSILENQLESNGKLSAGDYDYLTSEAEKLRNHPSLTNDQRSNVDVKISAYKKGKQVSGLKDTQDIGRLNREMKDDFNKNSLLFENNPKVLLKANADALQAKLEMLTDSITSREGASDDSS